MQGILKGTSKLMENLALKRPPLQIFAVQTAGHVLLNQYLERAVNRQPGSRSRDSYNACSTFKIYPFSSLHIFKLILS